MNNKEYMAAQRAESWREELRRNKKTKIVSIFPGYT